MQDMLVRLYDLPDYTPVAGRMSEIGIVIRPALAAEKSIVVEWVRTHFGDGWASETEVAFSFQPVACLIAIEDRLIRGFAVYEAAYKNFFGPTGVAKSQRGKGIGKALLLKSMMAMREQGYAYAHYRRSWSCKILRASSRSKPHSRFQSWYLSGDFESYSRGCGDMNHDIVSAIRSSKKINFLLLPARSQDYSISP